jgi:hypothetical protein
MHSVPEHQIRPALAGPLVLACAASALVLLLPVGSLARAIGATIIYFGVLLRTDALPDAVIEAARRLLGGRGLRTPS